MVTKSAWKNPGLPVPGKITIKNDSVSRKLSITVKKIHKMKNALKQ